eukprot:gene5936-7139_t
MDLKQVFGEKVWSENKHNFWKFLGVIHLRALEVALAPRAILRQVLLAFWIQVYYSIGWRTVKFCRNQVFSSSKRRTHKRKMVNAENYEEWKEAAEELDVLDGVSRWKEITPSPLYDWKRVENKLDFFEELLNRINISNSSCESTQKLIFHLRTGLKRDGCGLSNPLLYSQAHVGTKKLVEAYVAQNAELLQKVVEIPSLTNESKLALLTEARHAYGRTALLLSGGATLGLFHMGVIKSLWEQKLLPRIISGSSAGSLCASILACSNEQELPSRLDPYQYESLFMLGTVEEREGGHPFTARLRNLLFKGVLFDTEILKDFLRRLIGDLTFQEAFDKTGRVLNITVQPNSPGSGASRQPRLLNYLTYPNVLVWSACVASCAIPGVFEAVELYSKAIDGAIVPANHDGVKYSDGSFGNDLPILRLKELFNVNLFIVSQVNPVSLIVSTASLGHNPIAKMITFLKSQATSFLRNLWRTKYLQSIPLLCVVIPSLTQDMEGDITCVAPVNIMDILRIADWANM